MLPKLEYCPECGTKLIDKECENEGIVAYCETCQRFRFPIFNTAIIAIVMNPARDKILLIQQYGKPFNILVAGYVNKGESIEQTLIREVKEELGRDVTWYQYMRSEYFDRSESLMCNFVCQVDDEDLSHINYEVDRAAWYSIEDAVKNIKPDSLAQKFLIAALEELQL